MGWWLMQLNCSDLGCAQIYARVAGSPARKEHSEAVDLGDVGGKSCLSTTSTPPRRAETSTEKLFTRRRGVVSGCEALPREVREIFPTGADKNERDSLRFRRRLTTDRKSVLVLSTCVMYPVDEAFSNDVTL